MPFKHNAAHRCHIPQARYRVTNSLTYEAGRHCLVTGAKVSVTLGSRGSGSRGHRPDPMCLTSNFPHCASGGQVTLDVEGVVDCCMRGQETLSRALRLEPLHQALPAKNGTMRVLRPVVAAQLNRSVDRVAGEAARPGSPPPPRPALPPPSQSWSLLRTRCTLLPSHRRPCWGPPA